MIRDSVDARGYVMHGGDSDMLCQDDLDIKRMFCMKLPEFETSLSTVNHVSVSWRI